MMKALITGGNRGIGLAIARKLSEEGFSLIIVGRNMEELEAAKQELSEKTDVTAIKMDLRNDSELRRVSELDFDILINNAGVLHYGPLEDMSDGQIDEMVQVNLTSLMKLSKYSAAKVKMIINISSGAGKTGYGNMAAYCATKFGVIGFTESLAKETDCRVFAVCPQDTQTAMWEKVSDSPANYQPEDVAEVVFNTIRNNEKIRSGSAIDVR